MNMDINIYCLLQFDPHPVFTVFHSDFLPAPQKKETLHSEYMSY